MNIKDIAQKKVYTVNINTNIKQVAEKMFTHHIGSVIVTENTNQKEALPVGIVTDRDITKVFSKNYYFNTHTFVKHIMSSSLIMCREDESIFDVIKLMKTNGIRRVPIINKTDNLVGIVCLEDIIEMLSLEMKELVQLTRIERLNEAHIDSHINTSDKVINFEAPPFYE